MLAAFRWNLRLLSYISLVVGAFLIYKHDFRLVVRRRAEMESCAVSARAVDHSLAFVAKPPLLACGGAHRDSPWPLHGYWRVRLMAVTVESLYVSTARNHRAECRSRSSCVADWRGSGGCIRLFTSA